MAHVTVEQFLEWLFQPKVPKVHVTTHEDGGADEMDLSPQEAFSFFLGR